MTKHSIWDAKQAILKLKLLGITRFTVEELKLNYNMFLPGHYLTTARMHGWIKSIGHMRGKYINKRSTINIWEIMGSNMSSRNLLTVSLPPEYWAKIHELIGRKFIRNRGDAIMYIMDKVYPDLAEIERIQ